MPRRLPRARPQLLERLARNNTSQPFVTRSLVALQLVQKEAQVDELQLQLAELQLQVAELQLRCAQQEQQIAELQQFRLR